MDSDFNFTWTRKSVVYDKGIFFSFSFFCFWFGGEGGKRGRGVLYLNHTHSLTFYFSFSYSVHSLLDKKNKKKNSPQIFFRSKALLYALNVVFLFLIL